MKSLKLFIGTVALVLGSTSIAAWAADEAADKKNGEKVEKPDPNDKSETKRVEPICEGDDK